MIELLQFSSQVFLYSNFIYYFTGVKKNSRDTELKFWSILHMNFESLTSYILFISSLLLINYYETLITF